MPVSVFTEPLPVVFYFFLKWKNNDRSLKAIFILLCITAALELEGYLLVRAGRSNFFAYNLSLLAETLLLYRFLWLAILNGLVRKILVFLSLAYLVLWGYSFFTIKSHGYYENCVSFEYISLLALIIYFYFEQIIIRNRQDISSFARFWIISAYFIFIAGTFFLLLYLPTLTPEDNRKYYVLNYLFIIFRTVLLCIAMFKKPGEALPATL